MVERPIDSRVLEVAQLVAENGGRALLVGGCVRDRLLGLEAKDYDLEVFGIPAEKLIEILEQRFGIDLVGASFGILKIKGAPVDVSIPRRDSLIPESAWEGGARFNPHRAFSISTDPSMSLEEAARRRDFTINSISYDPLSDAYVDPLDARRDLDKRILRHTSDEHFAEDPLRVLRAMQFVARFEMQVHPDTLALCRSIDLRGLTRERVFDEWKKLLLTGRRISAGLAFLRDAGHLGLYPELDALVGCEQDPKWHPEGDVWVHTLHCMDFFADNRVGDEHEDSVVGFAVLCHDLGKPATTRLENGRIRAISHSAVGVELTETFLGRMTDRRTLIDEVTPLVKYHLVPRELYDNQASDAAIRRLARKVRRIDRLARVSLADSMGRPPIASLEREKLVYDWLIERAKRLDVVDAVPESILKGRHLLALGMKPGPRMGQVIQACYEKQLDGTVTSEEEAIEFAREYLRKHTE